MRGPEAREGPSQEEGVRLCGYGDTTATEAQAPGRGQQSRLDRGQAGVRKRYPPHKGEEEPL